MDRRGIIMVDRLKQWFHNHTDGRQKCTVCDRRIPKYIKRISFSYTNSHGSCSSKRICEKCLSEFAELIDHANVDKWRMELFKDVI